MHVRRTGNLLQVVVQRDVLVLQQQLEDLHNHAGPISAPSLGECLASGIYSDRPLA